MGTLGVTKATPLPSEAKNIATAWQLAKMSEAQKLNATCMFCKTVYRNASPANRCEHWHFPIPDLRGSR
jgi:hypothetical protein